MLAVTLADDARRTDIDRARVLKHPLRQRLIFEYSLCDTSPSKVAAVLGEPLNLVSYHTGVLLRAGCIELVRTGRRRGAVEHFYRALGVAEVDDRDWERLPESLRRAMVRRTLEVCWRDATDAVPLGGMDDGGSHVSRMFVRLDAAGRADLAALLRSTVVEAAEIERASERRGGVRDDFELVILHFKRDPLRP
jgi:hypothetical protein